MPSLDLQTFSSLLETLYRDAYAGSSWSATLQRLARQLGAGEAMLLVMDAGGPLRVESSLSPSRPAAEDPMPGLAGETPVLRNQDASATARRRGEGDHLLGFNVRGEGGLVYGFRLSRPRSQPGFSAAEAELCRGLVAHIRVAVNIRRTMVSLQTERILLGRAVNRYDTGVITLDRHGGVLELNDWVRALLSEPGQLYVEDRHLFLRDLEDDRRWNAMLRAAVTAVRDPRRSRTLGAMAVHDDAGGTRLGLLLRSIPQKQSAKDPQSPAFALYIRDAMAGWVAPSDAIRKLFGVTSAEASMMVHIARGLSIQEAATEMAISPNTAKSHLQAIFLKLGISKQSDLVRLALSSVAAIG
ncbi:MAG TPA: helix-turn-helix transcriptional regulator [Solimonas sp.]|nr:helix-turn-helix transcriptional regulator [Solimonas sp.]